MFATTTRLNNVNESEVKYLAGLLDADGGLSFQFAKTKSGYGVYLRLVLVATESVDRNGEYIKSLTKYHGTVVSSNVGDWAKRNDWVVTNRNELEMLLPRVIKHMVIKGKHWQRMLDKWRSLRGQSISDDEREALAHWAKESRLDSGPVKVKSHPTWAWVAGYLDGDGSFQNRYYPKKKYHAMRVNATAHENDIIALELLKKAFGGEISRVADTKVMRWWKGLGYTNTSFAVRFLRRIVQHSRLKKHQIEMILHNHSQRLSMSTPTGEATV